MIADVAFYYHWGPQEAWSLTWRDLRWWAKQAVRINKVRAPRG